MTQLIYLPLERMEERYTGMMNDTLAPFCDEVIYPGDSKENVSIECGQFVDVFKSCEFKRKQLDFVCGMFENFWIRDGATFLVADLQYPGLETLRYVADLLGREIHIYGWNHAGRSDSTDFIAKLGRWGDSWERTGMELCSGVLVGSEFQARRLWRYFGKTTLPPLRVVGLPFSASWCFERAPLAPKEDFVIWPHRLAREKGLLDLLRFLNIAV